MEGEEGKRVEGEEGKREEEKRVEGDDLVEEGREGEDEKRGGVEGLPYLLSLPLLQFVSIFQHRLCSQHHTPTDLSVQVTLEDCFLWRYQLDL